MHLRFAMNEIPYWSARYAYVRDEEPLIERASAIRQRKHLTTSDLSAVCKWKSPRSANHALSNDDEYVAAVTGTALSAKSERFRIEVLTCLSGVNWPTASVILHLFHEDPYPIVDVRALWSVSSGTPPAYTFSFWMVYVGFCRQMANKAGVSMRTLDRALWQYSKENQEPARAKSSR